MIPTEAFDALLHRPMGSLVELLRWHAQHRAQHIALIDDRGQITYGQLMRQVDQILAALQAQGLGPGDLVALCGLNTATYAAAFAAITAGGMGAVPLPVTATAESLQRMLADCGARLIFVDQAGQHAAGAIPRIALEPAVDNATPLTDWCKQAIAPGLDAPALPDAVFNVLYSSGTTGQPKGIVHTNTMRWPQIATAALSLYRPDSVTIVSTPLCSNTTLVSFLPALGGGGTTVLMRKFDEARFLALSARYGATHAMLVPVQYRRLLAHPDFDQTDLSTYRAKFCTSAPFPASLKAEVLRRWPGALIEYFGMSEGGGSCMLLAHEHPDKLHTVGQPMPGHDIRIIDENGRELPAGAVGEIVGHSYALMQGYLNAPDKNREVEWRDESGRRFIRTGDIGRFDEDGFLILMDRAKDVIISGGFNIYPSDIEATLSQYPDVEEAAVFGTPSETWGETPVAAVVPRPGACLKPDELLVWSNARLAKTQRLRAVLVLDALPRNPMGKVAKRELRERYGTLTA